MDMKKTILTVGIFALLLQGCSYKPIIDTAGRSGTFDQDRANLISDDIVICEKLAEDNTNQLFESYKVVHNWYIRPQTLWLMPKAEYTRQKLIRNCLTKRGHSVLN